MPNYISKASELTNLIFPIFCNNHLQNAQLSDNHILQHTIHKSSETPDIKTDNSDFEPFRRIFRKSACKVTNKKPEKQHQKYQKFITTHQKTPTRSATSFSPLLRGRPSVSNSGCITTEILSREQLISFAQRCVKIDDLWPKLSDDCLNKARK